MELRQRKPGPFTRLLAAALALGLSACTATSSKDDELENQEVAINTSNFRDALVRCSLKPGDRANSTKVSCSLFRPTRRGEAPFVGRAGGVDVAWKEPPEKLTGSDLGVVDCSYRNDRLTQDCEIELKSPLSTDVKFQASVTTARDPKPHTPFRVETLPFTIRTLGVAPQVPLAFRPDTAQTSSGPRGARRALAATNSTADTGQPGFQPVALPMNQYFVGSHPFTASLFCQLRGRVYIGGMGAVLRIEGAGGGPITDIATATVRLFAGNRSGSTDAVPTRNLLGIFVGQWTHIACHEGKTEAEDTLYVAFTEPNPRKAPPQRYTVARIRNGLAEFFHSTGTEELKPGHLSAVAIDRDGQLLLFEAEKGALTRMRPDGTFLAPRVIVNRPVCRYTAGDVQNACTYFGIAGSIAVDRDNSIYVALMSDRRVYRVPPSGPAEVIAGNGAGVSTRLVPSGGGDLLGPATQQPIGYVNELELLDDGSLLIASPIQEAIYRWTRDGKLHRFISGEIPVGAGSDDPRVVRQLDLERPNALFEWRPGHLLVGAYQGALYSIKHDASGPTSLRQVAGSAQLYLRDGESIDTVAGSGRPFFGFIKSIALDSKGRILVAEQTSYRLLRLEAVGDRWRGRVLAGKLPTEPPLNAIPDGASPTSGVLVNPMAAVERPDGAVVVAELGHVVAGGGYAHLRLITKPGEPDAVSTIIAGNGQQNLSGDNVPARQAGLGGPLSLAIDSKGVIWVADGLEASPDENQLATGMLRKLVPQPPGAQSPTSYTIHTVIGNGKGATPTDPVSPAVLRGQASARQSPFPRIEAVAVGPGDAVFIAGPELRRVFRVEGDRIVPIAGGGTSTAITPGMRARDVAMVPWRLATSRRGDIYVVDDLYRVIHLSPGADGEYRAYPVIDGTSRAQAACGSGVLQGAGQGADAFLAGLGSVCIGAIHAVAVRDDCRDGQGTFTLVTASIFDTAFGGSLLTIGERQCATTE